MARREAVTEQGGAEEMELCQMWSSSLLVLDDEPVLRDLFRRRLESEGFHVELAPNGEAALTLIQGR